MKSSFYDTLNTQLIHKCSQLLSVYSLHDHDLLFPQTISRAMPCNNGVAKLQEYDLTGTLETIAQELHFLFFKC